MSAIDLSVVSPFYNEAENLPHFLKELTNELEKLEITYEVILVDDGSTDSSVQVIKETKFPRITILKLTKNFGHQSALEAGINQSVGTWVVTLDSDLQHPPSAIASMLELAKNQKVEIIYGSQSNRKKDSLFKRLTAGLYYRLIKILTGISLVPHASDFRIISRKVANLIKDLPEEKIFRLLLPSLGFSSATYIYNAEPRHRGKSKYTFWKMFKLALGSAVSFSTTPLRIVAGLGFTTALIAFLWTIVVIQSYLKGEVIAGWTSMSLIILLLGGMQLFAIGLVGEYLARNLEISKQRPNYIIENIEKS